MSHTSEHQDHTTRAPHGLTKAARVGRWAAVVIVTGAVTAGGATAASAAGGPYGTDTPAWTGTGSTVLSTAPQVLKVAGLESADYAGKLQRAAERDALLISDEIAARQAEADRIAREEADRAAAEQAAREEAARRPALAFPAAGILTSGFGARWGTNHNGIDVANAIGTPIVSVTDGVVIETGPATGFGLWVRVSQDDGTIGVFGHIDQSLVSVGQHVRAGEIIATMGNRGQSTGPHLHYEVWLPNGVKTDPIPWFHARGIPVPGASQG